MGMKNDQSGMRLSVLLPNIPGLPDIQVRGLTRDSRRVKSGDLYVALKGQSLDGHAFIDQAILQGAVGVLCERAIDTESLIPCIIIPDLLHQLGSIAARFFDSPSHAVQVIGVTGTNGKTSCTQFIAQALSQVGKRCGVIGTLGSGFLSHLDESGFTTPDAIGVQQTLANLRDEDAQYVAMEVSSHGLDQQRVNGVQFELAIFTNLTRDHLDYHHSMEEYGRAKQKLFESPGLKVAIINADDPFGQTLLSETSVPKKIAFGLKKTSVSGCDLVYYRKYSTNARGVSADIITPWGEGHFKSRLLGDFNLSNILAVLSALCVLGVSFEHALQCVSTLETVPGRMQSLGGGKLPTVVVDYAHTPDALQKALEALRAHTSGKIWCVFGCGGERDHGKRPIMGQIAERFSDQLVITNDNPRSEDPKTIVDEIISGLICPWAAEVELDRGTAIAHAIDCAAAGDMVLIAGKGHEPYQLIGKERIPFNDIEQVKQHISRKRSQRNEESSDDTIS
jgi:UDP-N-acetylmuramoyl-L-alanyl-D-glutamate--2,6-diaminopimelate ligase